LAGGIYLTYAGRSSVFNGIVEPQREPALVGAIVLEDLDLVVDGSWQTLVPRDPKQIRIDSVALVLGVAMRRSTTSGAWSEPAEAARRQLVTGRIAG
jgi:hypothetical protein